MQDAYPNCQSMIKVLQTTTNAPQGENPYQWRINGPEYLQELFHLLLSSQFLLKGFLLRVNLGK